MKRLNEYELEMYKFLSQTSNFENMLLVLDNFEMVKRALLEEFWEGVKARVEDEMNIRNSDWKLLMNGYENPWWTLTLTKDKWPKTKGAGWDVAINWGHMNRDPHFGVWVQNESRVFNVATIHSEIKALASSLNQKQEVMQFFSSDAHPWWPLLIKSEHNFAEKASLNLILPDFRTPLIQRYAEMFMTLANGISDDLDKIIEKNTFPKG